MVQAGTSQPPSEASQVFEANVGYFLDPGQARLAFEGNNPAKPIPVPFRVMTPYDRDLSLLSASNLAKLGISGWKYFLVRDRRALAAGDVIDAGTADVHNYVLSAVTFGRYPRILFDAVNSLGGTMPGRPLGHLLLEILIVPELKIHAVCPMSPTYDAYLPAFERDAEDPGFDMVNATRFLDDIRGRLSALAPTGSSYTSGP